MVRELLVYSGDDFLSDFGSELECMRTVHQHLGFDDGHEAIGLADGGVTRKRFGILVNGEHRRRGSSRILDVQHSTPLGETRALSVILGAALAEIIDTLSHRLAVRPEERLDALVHLNTGNDALLLHEVHHRCTASCSVEECFLKSDGAGDVIAKARRFEQELAIAHTVRLDIFNANGRKALSDGACRFICGKDAFARCRDGICGSNQFSSEFNTSHVALQRLKGGDEACA